MDDSHKKFLDRLTGSVDAVFVVAKYLHMRGFDLEIPGLRKSPSPDKNKEYQDRGDIFIINDGSRDRTEVKGINTQFTGLDDWPHNDILISSQKTVERVADEVMNWVIVSKDRKHAAVITRDTRDQWNLIELFASNTGNYEKFYTAPKSAAKWITLE